MARKIGIFTLLLVVWFLWSGHTEPLIVGFGVFASAVGVAFASRTRILDEEAFPFHLSVRFVTFVPWVLWQIVLANLHVARVVLSPKLTIQPHLLRVPAEQKTVIGAVIHANTITITPGTVTLDLREGSLLIHALTDAAAKDDLDGTVNRRISELERGAAG
jgi:multicomponent Na+:H+ antiporter subunit E